MLNIIMGATQKPLASEELKNFFTENKNLEGYLYIGYPIIGTVEGAFPIDALWISKEHGLVIFNLVENKDIENYQAIQDDCANKFEAKLKGYKQLVEKRNLCVDINVLTFAPKLKKIEEFDEDYPLVNSETLYEILDGYIWNKSEYYEDLISVLQAISTIRKGKKRRVVMNSHSRGWKLKALEDSIANLDNQQSKAVIETVEGVQRIRGLAGSGKTIVIALKAAYLHAQHPDWKIVITFNTRSLKGQLKQLINTFYIEQTNEEPNWENLQIMHAWGAAGGGERNGIYYTFCSENNVEYRDYINSRNKFGADDPFGRACEKALLDTKNNVKELYDVILVDEAQDFSVSFLRMCYEMLKAPKRLVYAYDELQNLRLQSLPSPEEIFGNHPNGTPRVKFYEESEGKPQQDIILEKCYRNSRPALVTAHALGFGIYRQQHNKNEPDLVQMFEQNSLWNDVGYEVIDGRLEDGAHVVLSRTDESSPKFLEQHSDLDDLIQFKSFKDREEQDLWVSEQIVKNLKDDELRADDIIVINPDPLSTKKAVSMIRSRLFDMSIKSHTAGVDTTPDIFFSENEESIAFTGIYRAKGNEAAMVYVINSDLCYDSTFELAKKRNQLFTAITRSKAWVRVLGVGENMDKLVKEYDQIKAHNFTLDFIYPDKAQREKMNIINRDMSMAEKKKVERSKYDLSNLIKELENGEIFLEDLGEGELEKLRSLLKIKE
ncbi:TPA: DEAD/DEAH box helicase [Streptococcus equi subsp. zooepidemicus]|nr:DEAD/DEAH box helicase [Streptococcus equi subsp. zooepidemicus]HEL0669537.1 DEAD/DEAH box helicase [Streptococcus equi subsp. zooepidemicus]HEL0822100.1 DEAD/DEAH box helicase [Streptococcus equi subsp. zooepidemicus]HEL1331822.1 DEAD/DEAH box helicase [Streptococcus equi subsp. zooepidemicus]